MRLFFLALIPSISLATQPVPVPTPQNNNSQVQTQGQGQEQHQSQSSDTSGNGVLTINYREQLQIPHTPAPTAPAIYASNPCAVGESKALTLPVFGKSSGKSTIDSECSFRELVRVTASVDPCLARKLLATHPAIAALNEPVTCTPPPPQVTQEDLSRLEKVLKDRQGTVFRQSQSK